jgi:hypothetical protein
MIRSAGAILKEARFHYEVLRIAKGDPRRDRLPRLHAQSRGY